MIFDKATRAGAYRGGGMEMGRGLDAEGVTVEGRKEEEESVKGIKMRG